MRSVDRLEYGQCPTCGADALIGRTHSVGKVQEPPQRIAQIDCSDADCLHYGAVRGLLVGPG